MILSWTSFSSPEILCNHSKELKTSWSLRFLIYQMETMRAIIVALVSFCCSNITSKIARLTLTNINFSLSLHKGCSSPALDQTWLGSTGLLIPGPRLKKQLLPRTCCSHSGARRKRESRGCPQKLFWELEHCPAHLCPIGQDKTHGQAPKQQEEVITLSKDRQRTAGDQNTVHLIANIYILFAMCQALFQALR